MAKIKCHEYGKEKSSSALTCSNGGISNSGTMVKKVIFGVVGVLAMLPTLAQSSSSDKDKKIESTPAPAIKSIPNIPAERAIKPGMTISFAKGTVACLTKYNLQKIPARAVNDDATRENLMGGCLAIQPFVKFKVLSVEYNDTQSEIGIMEVVSEDSGSPNGAWVYTIGANPVN